MAGTQRPRALDIGARLTYIRRNAVTHSKRTAPKAPPAPRDIAILGGPTEDGQGAQVLRIRDGSISAGELRPAKEGQPITHSELVRLRPVGASERICEIEVLHAPHESHDSADSADSTGPSAEARSRPARVSSERYRRNWGAIFDAKRKTLN